MKPTKVVEEQISKSLKHHELEMKIAKLLESAGFEITRLAVREEMTTEYGGPKMWLRIDVYSNRMKVFPGPPPEGWPT